MVLQGRLTDRSDTPELTQATSSPRDAAGPLHGGTDGVRSSLRRLSERSPRP